MLTPIKSIRAYCLECMCGSSHEVSLCWAKDCPLYPYRLGKNPNIKPRELTPEQREKMAERLKSLRAKKQEAGSSEN